MEAIEIIIERLSSCLDFSDLSYKNFIRNNEKVWKLFEAPNADTIATQKMLHALGVFVHYGKPIFQITKPLTMALMRTDPPNFPLKDFKAPFPAFRLEPAPGLIKFGNAAADKIYVFHLEGDRFQVMVISEQQAHYASFPLTDPEKTLEDAIRETKESLWKDLPEEIQKQLKESAEESGIEDYFDESAFKFAINAVLYITSSKRDVEPLDKRLRGGKGQGSAGNKNAEPLRKIYLCGRKFQIEKEVIAQFTREGRKIMKRFMVRGHWKMQPYGEKRMLRKHIFVAPYWKGPTFAELLARNYVVKMKGGA